MNNHPLKFLPPNVLSTFLSGLPIGAPGFPYHYEFLVEPNKKVTLEMYREAVKATFPTSEVIQLLDQLVPQTSKRAKCPFTHPETSKESNCLKVLKSGSKNMPTKITPDVLSSLSYDVQLEVLMEHTSQEPAMTIIDKAFEIFQKRLNRNESINLYSGIIGDAGSNVFVEGLERLEKEQEEKLRNLNPDARLFWIANFFYEMFYVAIGEALEQDEDCQLAAKSIRQTRAFGQSSFSVENFITQGFFAGLSQAFSVYRLCFESALKDNDSVDTFAKNLVAAKKFLLNLSSVDISFFRIIENSIRTQEDVLSRILNEEHPVDLERTTDFTYRLAQHYADGAVFINRTNNSSLFFGNKVLELIQTNDSIQARDRSEFRRKCPALLNGGVDKLWDEFVKVCKAYDLRPKNA